MTDDTFFMHVSVFCVVAVIEEVSSKPFGVDPHIMMSIIKGLYSLNPGKVFLYAHITLFKCQCIWRRALIGDTFQIELEFSSVGFLGEGKLQYPEKNLSEQGREPTTNSTHI